MTIKEFNVKLRLLIDDEVHKELAKSEWEVTQIQKFPAKKPTRFAIFFRIKE